jgi:hypothetical protein
MALSSGLWAWAASSLPSNPAAPLGILMGVFAASQLAAALGVWAFPQRMRQIWRSSAVGSIAFGSVCLTAVVWTIISLPQSHGALGATVAALLAVIAVLVAAATLPLGLWGLWATRKGGHG